jgi:hypothetical protein
LSKQNYKQLNTHSAIHSGYIGAIYFRVKSSLEPRNNIGKIGRMSVAEVSKDPPSYRTMCVISTPRRAAPVKDKRRITIVTCTTYLRTTIYIVKKKRRVFHSSIDIFEVRINKLEQIPLLEE